MFYNWTSIIAGAVLFVVFISISMFIAYGTQNSISVTIKDKERVVKTDSSKYLVFTDKGVYQNTDSFWYMKFNSSDIYNQLEKGKKYRIKVYGFRIPFLSWYKNIIEVKTND